MNLRLDRLFVRRKELDSVLNTLVQDAIGPGEKSRELSVLFSRYWECQTAWCFNSPLSAVRFLFKSLNLEKGDSIILSPLAPSYYFEALTDLGVRILFCDVQKDSPVIDPTAVAHLMGENPRAAVLDASLGTLPDYDSLKSLGIFLIEDCSQGLGSFRDLHLAGTVGDVVVHVFDSASMVTTAQGAVVAVRSRKHLDEHFRTEPSRWDSLGDLNSSLAVSQWPEKEKLIEKKKEHYRYLFQRLNKQYKVPKAYGDSEVIPPHFAILAPTGAKEILVYAQKKGVEARLAFSPKTYLNSETDVDFCPNSRYFFQHTLVFPLYAHMAAKELEYLGKVLSTLP